MDILADYFDGSSSKITSSYAKEMTAELDNEDKCEFVDIIDTLQTLLLKQLPRKRICGVINLCSVLLGDGTKKDLEHALVNLLAIKFFFV